MRAKFVDLRPGGNSSFAEINVRKTFEKQKSLNFVLAKNHEKCSQKRNTRNLMVAQINVFKVPI